MIGILGGGESGVAAAMLATSRGDHAFVSDAAEIDERYRHELEEYNVRFEENGHSFDILARSKLIVKSPGIPDTAAIVVFLRTKGLTIVSELEFAYGYSRSGVIAITGSNGKTTTTNLVHHLLRAGGLTVVKGGNLGRSFSRLIVEEEQPDFYVLEVSSFQLDDIRLFKPEIAAILNISPDHLDRYDGSIEKYGRSKWRITENQDALDHLLIYAEDVLCERFIRDRPTRATVELIEGPESFDVLNVSNAFLRGRHNGLNASFAIAICGLLGLEGSVIKAGLESFVNDDHRMQLIAMIDGVEWINDSKATNVEATKYALEYQQKSVIWIAGGTDKGNDYSILDEAVDKVKVLVCLGLDNTKIIQAFKSKIPEIKEFDAMAEAVSFAASAAKDGEVVLLSPACASFDLFKNYEDRGRQFMQAVWDQIE